VATPKLSTTSAKAVFKPTNRDVWFKIDVRDPQGDGKVQSALMNHSAAKSVNAEPSVEPTAGEDSLVPEQVSSSGSLSAISTTPSVEQGQKYRAPSRSRRTKSSPAHKVRNTPDNKVTTPSRVSIGSLAENHDAKPPTTEDQKTSPLFELPFEQGAMPKTGRGFEPKVRNRW